MRPLSFRTSIFALAVVCSFALQAQNKVQTIKVEFEPYQQQIKVTGKLVSKAQQPLSFKISGVVASIDAEEGQPVKAGQILAKLDTAEIQAQVAQSQALYDNNLANLKRFKQLYKDNVISEEQLQAVQTQLEVARSNLQIARFNQKHAQIKATSDGVVLKRNIELNQMVSPQQAAFIVSSKTQGWVLRASVTDKQLVHLQLGDTANVSLDAYPGKQIAAELSQIAAASGNNGLFDVELRLAPQAFTLYSGLIANASIQSKQQQQVAMIPLSALVSANVRQAQLFVIDENNIAHSTMVELAFIEKGYAAISDGLRSGQRVVSLGASYISDGSQIIDITQSQMGRP
ncbi:efflux RND transporter periplasmic adaptor subunit [Neptunicella marina]|uniref:Efflux RND transporter periplasmic adaptor subunit n=1 Tax=Neptunicella marina TaxID=2125989 RepID=A0A8J6IUL9_9ALTE|nr:efflux RND transporter periplasmic adaptor subunit [Neptunicella marina]MBC3766619.1 efflux RND transporter periplasmic adaptor subunit [Neptunicella marina]